jgi:hypothetical protein
LLYAPDRSAKGGRVTLQEAIDLLGIEGHPTTTKASAIFHALKDENADRARKEEALGVVRDFLRSLRATTPALQAAYDEIPWGAGSPTEYQSLDACLLHYGSLEAEEAARRGAPRGAPRPRAPRPSGSAAVFVPVHPGPPPERTHFDVLYERARRAGVETWEEMEVALHAATSDPSAPPPPSAACVDLVLRLQGEGMAGEADQLTSMLARWLDQGRDDRFTAALALKWAVAQELALASLPALIRRVVAQATHEGDPARAVPYVRRFCSEQDAADVELLVANMTTDAPTVLRMLSGAFA